MLYYIKIMLSAAGIDNGSERRKNAIQFYAFFMAVFACCMDCEQIFKAKSAEHISAGSELIFLCVG